MIIDAIRQSGDPATIISIAVLAWINGFTIACLIFKRGK